MLDQLTLSNPVAAISRRTFLRWSGLGAGALLLSACIPAQQSPASPTPVSSGASTATGDADLDVLLRASVDELPILAGAPTRVLRYQSELLHGDPSALTALHDRYLGPILRVRTGQTLRIRLRNELEQPTNIHWHGLIIPAEVDGHPANLVQPGGETIYEFQVRNRAGTYWFHPHPHGFTAEQAYHGLAGMVIVEDDDEAQLDLPRGAFDLPLILQDRRFDADNQLLYIAPGMAGMNDQMMGFLGDQILVNGQPAAELAVSADIYRLRLLNGANSRIFKLAWSDGAPVVVIASDGGLLEQPITRPYLMLSPGERVELWADFSRLAVGKSVRLQSLAFEGVEAGQMSGMMHEPPALPNGAAFDVLTATVSATTAGALRSAPVTLTPIARLATTDAVNAQQPRVWRLAMDDAMNWTINGRSYEMGVVADDERVTFGATEIWEFVNELEPSAATDESAAGAMAGMPGMDHSAHMQHGAAAESNAATPAAGVSSSAQPAVMRDFMAHPMHIHGVQFQVLARQVADAQRVGWETVKDGLIDDGWKDTVLVMPGERVQVIMRFDGYPGLYMVHCHNLEHEDGGMMRNFAVE